MNQIYQSYQEAESSLKVKKDQFKTEKKALEDKHYEETKKERSVMFEIHEKYGDLASAYAYGMNIGPRMRSGHCFQTNQWSVEKEGIELFWDADHPNDQVYEMITWETLFAYEKEIEEMNRV